MTITAAPARHHGHYRVGGRLGLFGRLFLHLPAEIDLGDSCQRRRPTGTITQGVTQNLVTTIYDTNVNVTHLRRESNGGCPSPA